jgi:hypothetical protein
VVPTDSPTTADTPRETLETVRSRHRTERRQIADEKRALESFASEVRSLPDDVGNHSSPPAIAAQPTVALQSPSATGLELVRDAYRSTVMSVPHYEEEYGDTYAESVVGEFGPTLGAALTEGSRFDEQCRKALLAAVDRALLERSELVEMIDVEQQSIEAVSRTLDPVIEDLDSFETVTFQGQDFGSLDAYRARLTVLSERCDTAAADRQAAIRKQRYELQLPSEAPDVPTYLYREFQTRYPVLSLIAGLCESIEQLQQTIETTAANCRC